MFGWSSKRRRDEEPKVIFSTSWLKLVLYNVWHIPPVLAAVLICWVNFSRLYAGPTLSVNAVNDTFYLGSIQIAAKAIEGMGGLSLGCIVAYALIHELASEDGVPLGLLASGSWFSNIVTFLTPEFLGILRKPSGILRWRLLRYVGLLMLCSIIVTFLGPASAFLLTPRIQDFPAGGASFYMSGGSAMPTTLTSAQELDVCSLANATEYATCPSGGYSSLRDTLSGFNYTNFCSQVGQNYAPLCQAIGEQESRLWNTFLVRSPSNLLPSLLSYFRVLADGAVAVQPHAATAARMQEVVDVWNVAASLSNDLYTAQYKWTYELKTLGVADVPVVRAVCGKPMNLSSIMTNITFPALEISGPNWWQNSSSQPQYASIANLTLTPANFIRTQWLPLDMDLFGDPVWGMQTTGILVEMPWQEDSRVAFTCAVSAAWQEFIIKSQRSSAYGAWYAALEDSYSKQYVDRPDSKPYQRPITLDSSWLNLLSAATSETQPTLGGLLDAIKLSNLTRDFRTRPQMVLHNGQCELESMDANMTDAEFWSDLTCEKGNWVYVVQTIIAMLVSDGISRWGSSQIFDARPDLRDWSLKPLETFNVSSILRGQLASSAQPSTDTSVRWMQIYVVGYAWNPDSVYEYLALAVLLAYVLLVCIFVLYVFTHRRKGTSSYWHIVTELLVLCLNSPATGIENASAGISRSATYGRAVKLRAVPSDDAGQRDMVQLVVEPDTDADEVAVEKLVVMANKAFDDVTSSGLQKASLASAEIVWAQRRTDRLVRVDEKYR